MYMPTAVKTSLEELIKMCNENPKSIPIIEVAKFLGCKPDGLRNSMDTKRCPFGFAWQLGANRGYKIPTGKFFMWYTNATYNGPDSVFDF